MARIGGNQRNDDRHPNDLYPTHPHWTNVLFDVVKFKGPIWEPAAGNGDMVDVIKGRGYSVRATDISTGQDFLKCTQPWKGDIVTNPPYRILDAFIEKALELASGRVAMLMPIGALGGKSRHSRLWTVHPPETVLVVASRMPVMGKTSQFNHVWAIFNDSERPSYTRVEWRI